MSEILKHYFGEVGLAELEKVAQQVVANGGMEKVAQEESALDKLAAARANEILAAAEEAMQKYAEAEAGAASGEENPLDNAVNLRALEMLDENEYDVDKILGVLNQE